MGLADEVDTIFWAFPPGDSRRTDIRLLAERIRVVEAELAQVKAERDAAVLALRRVRFKCERELADINRIASGEPAPKDGER